jgi:hypothetical protein
MGFRFLPITIRSRLALAGVLTLTYIVLYSGYAYYNTYSQIVQVPLNTDLSPDKLDVITTTPDTTPPTGRTLLVSAVFPLPQSKYSTDDYHKWLQNYLTSITTDIYLYTTPELGERIKELRGPGLPITVDTNYSSPMEIPPLKGKEELYLRIQKKDRQRKNRNTNSTDLYALRNAKPFFLHSAVQNLKENGVLYEYAFWNDAASFRRTIHSYQNWPSLGRVQSVWEEGSQVSGSWKEDLMFVPISDLPHPTMSFWTESMGPIENEFSEGSFFGGTFQAIDWFYRVYYAYHDHYLSLEIFIGKDQSLVNSLFFLFPERFFTVWPNDPEAPAHIALNRTSPEQSSLGQCGSLWYYYQFWLADSTTQDAMRNLWIEDAKRWHWWGWWRAVDATRCQETRLLALTDVLKRRLGAGWHPPGHSINVKERET